MVETKADKAGIKIGMWLFLYTEIMLFGGLFVLYAAYHHEYLADFAAAGKSLDTVMGTTNTIVLLISSFTVACSITAIKKNSRMQTLWLISSSICLGITFLVIKYFEWGHKFHLGIYPGSETLTNGPKGASIFFGLYYVITGLHAVHIIIGLTLLAISFGLTLKSKVRADHYAFLENSGLYWHLVDMIWIFIFPLFYLIL